VIIALFQNVIDVKAWVINGRSFRARLKVVGKFFLCKLTKGLLLLRRLTQLEAQSFSCRSVETGEAESRKHAAARLLKIEQLMNEGLDALARS